MILLMGVTLMIILLSVLVGSLTWAFSFKLNKDYEKLSPFECGFSTGMWLKSSFSMQFFMVALIFLVFDIELVLLFPFLVLLQKGFSFYGALMLLYFLIMLSGGFALEWAQKSLEWSS